MEQARGFNPYKFGVVSGSDSHVSVVPYRQDNFFGVHGTVDDTIGEAHRRRHGAGTQQPLGHARGPERGVGGGEYARGDLRRR